MKVSMTISIIINENVLVLMTCVWNNINDSSISIIDDIDNDR
jgi:hypothetical protein